MKAAGTKEKILAEALKLFAQKGYEAVGVEEIAQAVGIRAPSLYKHYKSKKAIFDSILQRVNEMDSEQAKDYEMPQDTMKESAGDYKHISMENIGSYTKAMFRHWTEEEFSACFRKLITVEQYKSAEEQALYQQYIAGGPVTYMADVFSSLADSRQEAMSLALEFYGPMYLLYSLYDGFWDKAQVMELLETHLNRFFKEIKSRTEEAPSPK